MKINKRKFKINLIIIVCLVITLAFWSNALTAFGSPQNIASSRSAYIEIIVEKGDNIWDLASKHGNQRKDIRKTIYEIQKINNLSGQVIEAGEVLLIPTI